MRTHLQRSALAYATHISWPVFPCWPRGKEPLTYDGFRSATVDTEQIVDWWRSKPEANIGCPPGRAGLIVLDVDGPAARTEAIRLGLYAEPTLRVETGRGWHLYFRHPGGRIGNRRLARGIDVRADAGYVLLPPSVHPTGTVYRALGTTGEIGALPQEVVNMLLMPACAGSVQRPPSPPIEASTPRCRAYVTAAIEFECVELADTAEGNRNNKLNEAAFSLARFAATGEADAGGLADVLAYSARGVGLPEHEIQRTIASAFKARGVVVSV